MCSGGCASVGRDVTSVGIRITAHGGHLVAFLIRSGMTVSMALRRVGALFVSIHT